jgi:hypothetical protein
MVVLPVMDLVLTEILLVREEPQHSWVLGMSPFLVRIMTMAHLLSASVHVTSARGPNPVAIVLQLSSVNS